MFNVTMLNQKRTIYEGQAVSVFLPGDEGEFEVLTLHKPLISLLRAGQIIIDGKKSLSVTGGIVRVFNNELVALVEE